jgi:Ca-activated chloride channel family protein
MNFVLLVLILPILMGAGGSIYSRVKKGNESFEQKKYDEALQYYKNAQVDAPESPELHYNIGSTLYKVRKYDDAINEFTKVTSPDDPLLEEKSNYNTGVVQYRSGIQEYNQKNYQKAVEWLGKCIESNIAALKINPEDEDAKFNLEQARRKLKEINAELSKMQQEQQQNQQQQSQNQQQQQQSQSQQAQNNQKDEKSAQAEQKKESEEKDKQAKENEKQGEQKKDSQEEKQQQVAQAQKSQSENKPEEGKQEQAQLQQMSKEDADRLLQMLSGEEEKQKQIYQERNKGGDIYVEKDW